MLKKNLMIFEKCHQFQTKKKMTNKNSITDSNNNFTPVTDNADSISSMSAR